MRRLQRFGLPSGNGGTSYDEAQEGDLLEPIIGTEIHDILTRQGPGKVQGADGWGPSELAGLPKWWLGALGA